MVGSVRADIEANTSAREAVLARKAEVEELKQKLATAESPEVKRALVEAYRIKVEQAVAERAATRPQVSVKTSQELIAELKSRAGDDPAMQKRAVEMEKRLASIEHFKSKLQEIETAEGDEKRELVEEFRSEQRTLIQYKEQERAERQTSSSPPEALPPAMQAIRAKAEERKQEIETLKAALEQAQPQERVELIDAFRERQQAAMAERRQELEARKAQSQRDSVQP